MTQQSKSLSPAIGAWLAVVIVLGAAIRLHHLDAQSTWVDELSRIVWAKGYEFDRWFGTLPSETGARLPARNLKHALRVVNAHNPPLYGIVLNTWIRAVGSDSDFAARIPSVALGVLSIIGMFLAARQLLGPAVGGWAAALVAFSPFHVFYAQEVNHYTLAACLIVFSYWFYFRWLERPTIASGFGLALTGLGALYTHYYAAIALAFQATELILRYSREPRRLARASLPYLAVAAGFAPYLPVLWSQLREMTHPAVTGAFQGTRYFAERMQAIGVVPWLGDRGEYLTTWVGAPIAALGIVLVVSGIRSAGDRPLRRLLLLNAAGPVAVVAALFWLTKGNSILWSRYQLVFTFAQLIPVAVALHHRRRWRWIAVPALSVLAIVGFRAMFVDLVKEDWKGAAAAIASHGGNDEHVLVYRPNLALALGRYLGSENRLFGLDDSPDLPRLLAIATDGQEATWFVSAWVDRAEVMTSVHSFLSCRYSRKESFPIPPGRVGLAVTRYSDERAAGATAQVDAGDRRPGCAGPSAEPAEWEVGVPGPTVEAAWIDAPVAVIKGRSLTVTGWAFSTRGIRSLMFAVDGREVLRSRHVGLPRSDVAATYRDAPETHSQNAGIWAAVDVTSAGPGVHSLVVTAVHADGTMRTIGAREFTVMRQDGPGAAPSR